MRFIYSNSPVPHSQVCKDPVIGELTPINGFSLLDSPPDIVINGGVPTNPQDDAFDMFTNQNTGLISYYPNFTGIFYNALSSQDEFHGGQTMYQWPVDTSTSIDNSSGSILPSPYDKVINTRFQYADTNYLPNITAILPVDDVNDNPGAMITDTLDLSGLTPAGSDKFMVYWKIYFKRTTSDVLHTSLNSPAISYFEEILQEFPEFTVGISLDGSDFEPVNLLETVSFPFSGNIVRLCFLNTGNEKIYVGNFAVMFNG